MNNPDIDNFNKKVAVVLVNWNGYKVTRNCIKSLLENNYADLKIILVDNNSQDGSCKKLGEEFKNNKIKIIKNNTNLGFCEANNQGIYFAIKNQMDYVFILNNDTTVEKNLLTHLVSKISKYRGKTILVPKIYYASNKNIFWFCFGRANLWTGIFSNPFYQKKDAGEVKEPIVMDFMVGCAFFAPIEVFLEIGGFDPSFFMYCEDIDFSFRARSKGYQIFLEPDSKIYHHVSFSGDKEQVLRRYYMTRNHLWVLRRHSKLYHHLLWLALVPLRSFFRCVKALKNGQPALIGAEIKGVFHGLFGKILYKEAISCFSRIGR